MCEGDQKATSTIPCGRRMHGPFGVSSVPAVGIQTISPMYQLDYVAAIRTTEVPLAYMWKFHSVPFRGLRPALLAWVGFLQDATRHSYRRKRFLFASCPRVSVTEARAEQDPGEAQGCATLDRPLQSNVSLFFFTCESMHHRPISAAAMRLFDATPTVCSSISGTIQTEDIPATG